MILSHNKKDLGDSFCLGLYVILRVISNKTGPAGTHDPKVIL